MDRIVRTKESMRALGLASTVFFTRRKKGLIPPPIVLAKDKNGNCTAGGLFESELEVIATLMAAGATDDLLREEVQKLVERRQKRLREILNLKTGEAA